MWTTNPENEIIIGKIVRVLSDIPVGTIANYKSLSAAVGRDVQNDKHYLLVRARDRAEKQLGAIFECVRGVGIKRLNASEAPEVGLSSIRGIRRKAKRGARRLVRIDSNSLSDAERKRAISYGSLLGAIAMMADGNKARTVAAVIDPAKPIPPEDILRMFV